MQVKSIQNTPREHSAILSTFIKLPFVFETCFLSFLSGCLRQVLLYQTKVAQSLHLSFSPLYFPLFLKCFSLLYFLGMVQEQSRLKCLKKAHSGLKHAFKETKGNEAVKERDGLILLHCENDFFLTNGCCHLLGYKNEANLKVVAYIRPSMVICSIYGCPVCQMQ